MSSSLSLMYVAQFERRIENIQMAANEKFIREFLADVVSDCPIAVLGALATVTLQIRKRELTAEAQDN